MHQVNVRKDYPNIDDAKAHILYFPLWFSKLVVYQVEMHLVGKLFYYYAMQTEAIH